MGLSASMWTSVSGLLTHGEKMNVVGNNIANVSTIGFKGQRADFNDYLYLSGGSTSGPTQIGAGVSTYAIIGDFSQGSLEATNSVTDMAIDGNGFFKVRQPNTNQMYYTRAGDFYFNADRQLQNPEGYRLQGWKVDGSSNAINFMGDSVNIGESQKGESAFQGTGTPTDIVLDSWYLTPQRTSSISFTMGLTSDANNDRTTSKPDAQGKTSPTAALWGQWNANNVGNPPIADSAYATSSSIKIYDESGLPHTATVYYDQVSRDSMKEGTVPAGYTIYEYTVTIPPSEDKRMDANGKALYTGEASMNNPQPNKEKAGVLMTGSLIFDASGNLINQSAYTWDGTGDIDAMSSWKPTEYSNNGLPVFAANFTGQENASTVLDKNKRDEVKNYLIELDFGLRNLNNEAINQNTTLADVGDDYSKIALFGDKTHRMANSSMAASSTFVVQDSTQNGYPSGILSGTNITNDGVVYGYYDNGETIPLYQIALYDFHNKQGLRREGGNLYAQTKESGEARQGVAGDNGFGAVRAYNIEGSNVDMSREFVNMITTQRGFQANSKGITTVDNMLETVIGMKR